MGYNNIIKAITSGSAALALCFMAVIAPESHAAQPSLKADRPEPVHRIALLPLENLSEDKDALEQIMPILKDRLKARGVEVVAGDGLNRLLLKKRVRTTGFISKDLALKIRRDLDAKAIFVGSVLLFMADTENPQLGLSARLIDSSNGLVLWADYASFTGEDFTTLLGLGKVKTMEDLVPRVIDNLLDSFNPVPPVIEKESIYRLAVMPFRNKSNVRRAGTAATYMFLVELFKSNRFDIVEYGEVREAIVGSRIRFRGEMDYNGTETLTDSLGVDGILVGAVEHYSDGLDTSSPPAVEISARVIDSRDNKILWFDSSRFRGDEDIIVFDWGRVRSVDKAADRAISRLVRKMEKARWQ